MGIPVERFMAGNLAGIRDRVSLLPVTIRKEDVNPIDPEIRRGKIQYAYEIVLQTLRLLDMSDSKSAEAYYHETLGDLADAKYKVDRRFVVEVGRRRFFVSYSVYSIDAYLATLPPRVEYPF